MGNSELKFVMLKSILLGEEERERERAGERGGEESDIKEKIKVDNYWSSGVSAIPGRA